MSKGIAKSARTVNSNNKTQLSSGNAGTFRNRTNVLPAGKLNRRITLLKRVEVSDQGGGDTETFTPWVTVWAAMQPMKGKDIFYADQLDEELTYLIEIRYKIGVTPDMRIKYKDRLFYIRQVIDLEESHETIQIMAQEMQATGITR